MDALPGLGPTAKNDLGQYIPVAVPDTTTFPGSDYYVIACGSTAQKMNKDLPATTLRGYVQLNNGTDPATGQNTVAPAPIQYLGPMIVAQRDRPVRVKFVNQLPTGDGGNLFLPDRHDDMGAGGAPTRGHDRLGRPQRRRRRHHRRHHVDGHADGAEGRRDGRPDGSPAGLATTAASRWRR